MAWWRPGAKEGKFTDFGDFMTKVPVSVCNKRVLESLCKAGAFDSLGYARRALVAVHTDAVDQYLDLKRNEAIGQDSLFGGLDDDFSAISVKVPALEEWDKRTLLAFERDMLGLYVSDHPLTGLENVLAQAGRRLDRPARDRREPRGRLDGDASPGWSRRSRARRRRRATCTPS